MNTKEQDQPNSVAFTVRVPSETKAKLDSLARGMGRSTNYVAGEALASYVTENAWQVEAIGQAVADADAGGAFFRHEDVLAYFEALDRGERPAEPEPIRSNP
jgi:predicted transcriptional regulator